MTADDRFAPDFEAWDIWTRAHLSAHPAPPVGERMEPLELLTAREALGLTREALAASLRVSVPSIRAWESGHRAIPDRVRRDMAHLEAYTTALATALGSLLTKHGGAPALAVYTRDDELPELDLPDTHLVPTARWWRVVAHRAATGTPGTRIVDATTHHD